jgi:hypothetical protein
MNQPEKSAGLPSPLVRAESDLPGKPVACQFPFSTDLLEYELFLNAFSILEVGFDGNEAKFSRHTIDGFEEVEPLYIPMPGRTERLPKRLDAGGEGGLAGPGLQHGSDQWPRVIEATLIEQINNTVRRGKNRLLLILGSGVGWFIALLIAAEADRATGQRNDQSQQ